MNYWQNIDKRLLEYFRVLLGGDSFPEFIDKYLETKEMKRLAGVGQFCGCDYTNLFNVKFWYSRLDHSVATALMTWHFTKDKTQTICALFHDLGTPVFSHCIDFFYKDYFNQGSSEKSVYEMISNSDEIKKCLIDDGVNFEDILDASKYTIVENKKPKICVDRLDGVLHTCYIWVPIWEIQTIKRIYNDLAVLKNEFGEEEIGFKTLSIAEKFFKGVYHYSMSLQSNEDKFAMQFVADMLLNLKNKGELSLEDLYTSGV
jgi:hypothetical protein